MCQRKRIDLLLTGKIAAIHRRSRDTYGSPNIHAELADDHGIRVGRKRVARLMRAAGLKGATLRKFVVTTTSDPQARKPVDLVERNFYATARIGCGWRTLPIFRPGRVPVPGDGAGRVLAQDRGLGDGYEPEDPADPACPRDGGDAAATERRHPPLRPRLSVHQLCLRKALPRSRSHALDGLRRRCLRNAMAESFFATLEREVLNRRRFRSQAEARMAVFEWIEGWYNPHRRHSSLGYRSPANYERAHQRSAWKLPGLLPPPASDRVRCKMNRIEKDGDQKLRQQRVHRNGAAPQFEEAACAE